MAFSFPINTPDEFKILIVLKLSLLYSIFSMPDTGFGNTQIPSSGVFSMPVGICKYLISEPYPVPEQFVA